MGKRRGHKKTGACGSPAPLRERLREDELRGGRKTSKPRGGSVARFPECDAASAPLPGDASARIAIVGGGAAGLAAAAEAGRALRERGVLDKASVVVFEADERAGRSILATGNGRCNFSNARIAAACYRNAEFVAQALASLEDGDAVRLRNRGIAHDPHQDPVHRFFEDAGLVWREEGEGRLYPMTGKASTVVDVLRAAAAGSGALEACGRCVMAVEPPREEGGLFHLRFADGSIEHAAVVIMAVGGTHAASGASSDRHAGEGIPAVASLLPDRYGFVPSRPVLGPLAVREAAPRRLDNIRVRVCIRLVEGASPGRTKAEERGEVLFRSYGVSGICVFNLSRFAEPGDSLLIDFLPHVDGGDVGRFLSERRMRLALPDGSSDGARDAFAGEPLTCETFLRGLLLPQIGRVVLDQAGLEPSAPLLEGDLPALGRALSAFALTVDGIGDARQCQVLRGGLAVDRFDPQTMGSRLDAGLFAAGEALDVDAPCGGYNLHWAWASGLLAARSAARFVAAVLQAQGDPAAQGIDRAVEKKGGRPHA